VNEFTEIGVLGKEDALFIQSEFQDFLIFNSRRDLCDCQDVVAGGPERTHYGKVAALVGEESHCSGFRVGRSGGEQNDFFMRDRLCGVGDRRPDVFAREPRIRIKQIVFGSAFRELAKDQFYFDPRTLDDRLSHHHLRVDLDSICGHKLSDCPAEQMIQPLSLHRQRENPRPDQEAASS
jgi:hypothetical protein